MHFNAIDYNMSYKPVFENDRTHQTGPVGRSCDGERLQPLYVVYGRDIQLPMFRYRFKHKT